MEMFSIIVALMNIFGVVLGIGFLVNDCIQGYYGENYPRYTNGRLSKREKRKFFLDNLEKNLDQLKEILVRKCKRLKLKVPSQEQLSKKNKFNRYVYLSNKQKLDLIKIYGLTFYDLLPKNLRD